MDCMALSSAICCFEIGPGISVTTFGASGSPATRVFCRQVIKLFTAILDAPDNGLVYVLSSQGILKGEVSLYCWPPVWLVWNQLYDNWQFLFLFAKQTNPNQSNRGVILRGRGTVILPCLVFPALTLRTSKLECLSIESLEKSTTTFLENVRLS